LLFRVATDTFHEHGYTYEATLYPDELVSELQSAYTVDAMAPGGAPHIGPAKAQKVVREFAWLLESGRVPEAESLALAGGQVEPDALKRCADAARSPGNEALAADLTTAAAKVPH